MGKKAGDSFAFQFPTKSSSGVLTNADSTPTGSMIKNGVADGTVTVTITNVSTGVYKATGTIPGTYTNGSDEVQVLINATVGGNASGAFRDYGMLDKRVNDALDSSNAVSLRSLDTPVQHSGTAQTGSTSSTIKLAAGASSVDDFYKGALVKIYGGTGSGQSARLIIAYNGTTKVATLGRNWVTTPDNTSTYAVLASGYPRLDSNLAASTDAYALLVMHSGTARAGDTTSISLATAASSVTDFYKDRAILITGGSGAGQLAFITAYDGGTRSASVTGFASAVDNTSTYAVLSMMRDPDTWLVVNQVMTGLDGLVHNESLPPNFAEMVIDGNGVVRADNRNGEEIPDAPTLATQVESQIMDEDDGRQVLQAIVNKINAVDPDLSGLTLSAIAQAVRDQLLTGAATGSLGAAIVSILADYMRRTDNVAGLSSQAKTDVTNSVPTAAQVRTEMDANSTKLATAASDATAAKTNTASLPSMIDSNKFTADALANAPTGGGGGDAQESTLQKILTILQAKR